MGEQWGRNSSISCEVRVPQTAATCMPEGEPQRAGPERQMRGRETETERASGRRGDRETRRQWESKRARDFESIIVRPTV